MDESRQLLCTATNSLKVLDSLSVIQPKLMIGFNNNQTCNDEETIPNLIKQTCLINWTLSSVRDTDCDIDKVDLDIKDETLDDVVFCVDLRRASKYIPTKL